MLQKVLIKQDAAVVNPVISQVKDGQVGIGQNGARLMSLDWANKGYSGNSMS